MTRRNWLWSALLVLPLAIAGAVYGQSLIQPAQTGYICPVTGEELPCPLCCPYDQSK